MSILRALLFVAVASATAAAQGPGRVGELTPSQPPKPATPQVRTVYTDHDRDSDSRVIVVWYREHPAERADAPGRGRGRGQAIAPGYEKQLLRSAIVPVEYREYVTPAPVLLVRTLPPVRAGWEFVVIGNHVLLVNKATWRIIDVVAVF